MRAAQIEISRRALGHNLRIAQKLSGAGKTFAVIKSNGYGHGLAESAKALKTADGYAVAFADEAAPLRQLVGPTKEILVLQGWHDREDAKLISELGCIAVMHTQQQLHLSNRLQIRTWLKINSGMNRLGFEPHEVAALLRALPANIRVEALMTHFATANQKDQTAAQRQARTFYETVAGLSYPHSLANSAALLALPSSRAAYNRPGLMLYGASPRDEVSAKELGLKPAMTLKGRLIALRRIRRGAQVGYDATWRATRDGHLGMVGLGYGDGYPRLSNSGAARVPALLNKKICYLAGRVSMDSLCLDLSDHPTARLGDEVIFWGDDLPIATVAAAVGRSPYDLLAGLTGRLTRIYKA